MISDEDLEVLLTILKGENKMEKYGVDKSSLVDKMEKVAGDQKVSKDKSTATLKDNKVLEAIWEQIKESTDGKTKKEKD